MSVQKTTKEQIKHVTRG